MKCKSEHCVSWNCMSLREWVLDEILYYWEIAMQKVFVRNPYNYDMDKVSDDTGLHCMDESLADDSQREASDINNILRQFKLTGLPVANVRAPVSGDFTGVSDFKQAMDSVIAAREEFMRLPADVRYRFANDPQRLLEFVADERNRKEAEALGLVIPQVAEVDPNASVVDAVSKLTEVMKPKG